MHFVTTEASTVVNLPDGFACTNVKLLKLYGPVKTVSVDSNISMRRLTSALRGVHTQLS